MPEAKRSAAKIQTSGRPIVRCRIVPSSRLSPATKPMSDTAATPPAAQASRVSSGESSIGTEIQQAGLLEEMGNHDCVAAAIFSRSAFVAQVRR